MGEVVCVLGAVVSVVVAVLAAGPVYWQHEPFHAQLNPIGGMVGSLPRPPLIGLTCASMGPGVHLPGLGHHLSGERAGHRANVRVIGPTCGSSGPHAQDAFTETKEGMKGSQASRRSLYAQGDDGGGTLKDPALRCVRSPRRRCRKVGL